MEGGRFLVPIIPVLAALAPRGLLTIKRKRFVVTVISALLLFEVFSLGVFAAQESTGVPIWHSPKVPSGVVIDDLSWFEKMNRANIREAPAMAKLDSLVTSLRETRGEKITIMSGQMGMVAYYTAREHFGSVQFVDRYGLATVHIMSCKLTSRRPVGRRLPLKIYFDNKEALYAKCQIPEPMIIFDIDPNDKQRPLVARNGYTVIYSQSGYVHGDPILKGFPLRANEFIAVREDLASLIGITETEEIDWGQEP